ncbi:MAG: T9SS type A sorting domain-containing protein [Bacteroidales bacterium]|nr:T9SS type A sorting domain-containing protein [Bacteroidales bacterium]
MKKLLLFVAVAFLTAMGAEAQIFHTDFGNNPVVIDPDMMEYELSLTGTDAEFMIQNYSSMDGMIFFASFENGAAVVSTEADYNANVNVLTENTNISSSSVFFGCDGGSPFFNVLYLEGEYTAWLSANDKRYVGFRFINNGQYHYGWACLKLENNGNGINVLLYGYAYNSTPNAPIRAGESDTFTLGLENANAELFSVYPNPVENILTINGQNIDKVSVFNTLGQQISEISNPCGVIDLSNLDKGVYFLNINSCGKSIKKKIIKK